MCKRNATATWSGFSHQGQVGLLLALRKMQEEGLDLNTYFLEYETTEDVAIYKQEINGEKTYLSVHQVKAYYSGNNTSKIRYSDVLNNPFQSCGNDFLHTVVPINDWDTSKTTNNNSINRYPYKSDKFYCDTTEIDIYIKEELRKLLRDDNGLVNTALQRLTYELDNKIRIEHKNGNKASYNISFSLKEIDEFIRDTSAFHSTEIYNARKTFYELYHDAVKAENCDDDLLQEINDTIIDPIYCSPDDKFMHFLQRLSFSEKPETLSEMNYIFDRSGFRSVFFKSLLGIIILPGIEDDSVKYKKYGKSDRYLLTTIMREQDEASITVENIIKNCYSQDILWDNHLIVNKNISGKLIDLNPSIMNIPGDGNEEHKFMFYSSSNKLITVEETKNILNND